MQACGNPYGLSWSWQEPTIREEKGRKFHYLGWDSKSKAASKATDWDSMKTLALGIASCSVVLGVLLLAGCHHIVLLEERQLVMLVSDITSGVAVSVA